MRTPWGRVLRFVEAFSRHTRGCKSGRRVARAALPNLKANDLSRRGAAEPHPPPRIQPRLPAQTTAGGGAV